MYSKLLVSFLFLLQNEELFKQQTSELNQLKKVDNLEQLVTLLTIALITILSLLTLALYQKYKLKKEIVNLEKQLKI